ncbi:MAG: hypothetical protein FRX48_05719 [Lasallia pustulata]|uniref:Uncharacterized protein n=1 Tax=Lasallia pustulata TaxID=136370 RepID=A0A5M8PMT5_9LECA|nr:MAG: hypothetical protein FRX48_05719 [Lasallia pustulata]
MSSAPLSTAPPHRGDVSLSDFHQGCILFLKKREQVLNTHFDSSGIQEVDLDHPALVIQTGGPWVEICLLTSFRGRSVHKRFPRQPKMRAKYLPIHPRQQIDSNGIQLHLANGVVLRKHSYVNISKLYTVHISMLRRYNRDFPANHYQLGKQSVKAMLHCIHQQHPDQAITADIVTSTVVPSTIATHRQDSMGSSIGSARHYIAINIDRLSGLRTCSYSESPHIYHQGAPADRVSSTYAPLISHQHNRGPSETLPRYNSNYGSVIRTTARPKHHSQNVCEFFRSNESPSLQFLRRNWSTILFLLAACALSIGAVFGIIWLINTICRGLAEVGHWITGEWKLLLSAGGKVSAAVGEFFHSIVQAVKQGWHIFVAWVGETLRAIRH